MAPYPIDTLLIAGPDAAPTLVSTRPLPRREPGDGLASKTSPYPM